VQELDFVDRWRWQAIEVLELALRGSGVRRLRGGDVCRKVRERESWRRQSLGDGKLRKRL
jgi:hypothetical protein